jgi:hypothetical protein
VTTKLAIARRQLEARFLFGNSVVTFSIALREARAVERVVVSALEMRLCV